MSDLAININFELLNVKLTFIDTATLALANAYTDSKTQGGGGYNTIISGDGALPQRTKFSINGAVQVTDNPATETTEIVVVPSGLNGDIQFNDNGTVGSDNDFRYDKDIQEVRVVHTNQDTTRYNKNYSPTGTEQIAEQYWNETEKTISFAVEGGTIETNKELFDIYVDTNNNLVDGNVVSVVGINGNRQAVAKTDATNRNSATACIGMVTHKNIDGTVRVTKKGRVKKLNTAGFIEGLPIYVNPASPGTYTQTPPTAPNYFIHVGILEVANINNGMVDADIQVSPILEDLSNVDGTVTTVDDTDLILKKNSSGVWQHILQSVYRKLFKEYHGVESYTPVTIVGETLTLPACTYWFKGLKKVCSANITLDLSTTIANTIYYVYFDDASGVLRLSTSAWSLKNHVPIVTLFPNTAGVFAIVGEYHNHTRDLDWHVNAHTSIGARYISGGAMLNASTIQIASGTVADEDLQWIVNSVSNTARIWYQIAGGLWEFADSTRPTLWTGTAVQYPNSSYVLTTLATNRYIPIFIYENGGDADRQFYFVTPTTTSPYTSPANARAVAPPDLSGTGWAQEAKLIHKIIVAGDGTISYSATTDDLRQVSSLPSGGSQPVTASAVSFAPTGNITETNVQTAVAQLDTIKAQKTIQTTTTVFTTGWTLDYLSGLYEYDLADANITASKIVDIIPNNADIQTVKNADMYPRTESGAGTVKIFAKYLPTADIGVTLNIQE